MMSLSFQFSKVSFRFFTYVQSGIQSAAVLVSFQTSETAIPASKDTLPVKAPRESPCGLGDCPPPSPKEVIF